MTEDEAKTKFCCGPPFVAAVTILTSEGGYVADESAVGKCIGSACMAWRGTESNEFKARAGAAFQRHGTRLSPTSSDIEGFCGLAGAPS